MKIENMSITEIREYLSKQEEVSASVLKQLLADQRKGVVELARQLTQRQERQAKLAAKWEEMSQYERACRQQGKTIVVGIDEVGRGPLAGPVVAAAVALKEDFYLPGLDDSKKVPEAMRQAFYEVIMREAQYVGIGIVSAERIDEINILEATREAMRHAVLEAGTRPDICLIDAVQIPDFPFEQRPIIGGDGKSVSIAAASIVAKVTRDRLMAEYSLLYPEYGFEKNAGYGTEEHLRALHLVGPSPIHRRTFGAVKELAAR
ncbi:ribonuclease HII [Brevibacillus sp. B_LB10_24]|uniref:ribonuclease HII n=1 Tax=Brevibacillus sp. B_LB10_24 TaxID=3380645 RepID=UPI0038BB6B24